MKKKSVCKGCKYIGRDKISYSESMGCNYSLVTGVCRSLKEKKMYGYVPKDKCDFYESGERISIAHGLKDSGYGLLESVEE